MREGGTERTVFKMSVKLSKLEARMDYEAAGAAPLALLSMEAVHFDLAIHPSTMKLTASLGNLRGQDGQLPEVRGLGGGSDRSQNGQLPKVEGKWGKGLGGSDRSQNGQLPKVRGNWGKGLGGSDSVAGGQPGA